MTRPPPGPTPTWRPLERFDPVDAGDRRGSGYTGYTETFAATTTVQRYLGYLPDGAARIATCGFAYAYLLTRMGEKLPEELSDADAEPIALEPGPILGWLAEIHRVYPDNCPPDSSFVASALRQAVLGYGGGRSLALERAYTGLATQALAEGLGYSERSKRLDPHKATSDLDPVETRRRLAGAACEGARLARLHGAGG